MRNTNEVFGVRGGRSYFESLAAKRLVAGVVGAFSAVYSGEALAGDEGGKPPVVTVVGETGGQKKEEVATAKPTVVDLVIEGNVTNNFNNPSNRVNNFAAFNNRDKTFTLQNVMVDVKHEGPRYVGRLVLQSGHTGNTYYLAEPSYKATNGAGETNAVTWRIFQQVNAGIKVGDFKFEAGVFPAPLGPEGFQVRENFDFGRSVNFYGFFFYTSGIKATYALNDNLSFSLWGVNGGNSVVDNNDGKSVIGQFGYFKKDVAALNVVVMSGPERPRGAPEGNPWRHDLEINGQVKLGDRVWVGGEVNVGFERGRFGTTHWQAGAGYVQGKVANWLYLAGRVSALREIAGKNSLGEAGRIFYPSELISEETMTIDFRPYSNESLRLFVEGQAKQGKKSFFKGQVAVDQAGQDVPNADRETLITGGFSAALNLF